MLCKTQIFPGKLETTHTGKFICFGGSPPPYGPRWPEPNGTGNVVWSQQNQSSSPMRGKGHQGDSHRGDDGWLINRRWLG